MSEVEWPEKTFHSGDMVIVRKSVVGLTEASLTRFVRQAARAVALPGWVNVLLTTNNEMRSLNLRFRGKNTPTDVLSFSPMHHCLYALLVILRSPRKWRQEMQGIWDTRPLKK